MAHDRLQHRDGIGKPVVSITMRSQRRDRGRSAPGRPGRPACRRVRRERCSTGSRRKARSRRRCDCSTSRWSMPTSPNSLTMTAVSRSSGSLEQPVEQRRLAGAEEAGQDGHGDRLAAWLGHGRSVSRRAEARCRRVVGPRRRDRHVGIVRRASIPAPSRRPAYTATADRRRRARLARDGAR